LWPAVIVLVSGLLVAVADAGSAQRKGGTLRISLDRDLDSVDPALAYTTESWALEYATCAKLYSYPDKPLPEGASVVPEVATGLPTVSKDGRTLTIRLRHGFRFSTGQAVTAANFVAAFNRDADPNLQSPAVSYLHEIVGADAVIDGGAKTISGITAPGRFQLQIRTTQPLADLVYRLTLPFFCPIPSDTPPHEITNPVGSGPYYVASRVPSRETMLKRNPYYSGDRPANVDQIVWSVGLGAEACRAAVEQDQQDYCGGSGVPAADYRELATTYGINRSGGQLFFKPTLAIVYFAFNHDRPAFKGPGQIPLAKAINWAIDRPALVRTLGYLGGERTDQILPPAIGRNAKLYPLGGVTQRSLAKARELLAQATFKPKSLVLYAGGGPTRIWAQILQYNLKRLGIEVDIKYFPSGGAALVQAGNRGEPFDIAIASWGPDYADGFAYFGPLLDGNQLSATGNANIAYFDQPKYNQEIERIESMSGEARSKAWADLDVEMMRDDPPWAPFMVLSNVDFISKSFGCYIFQPAISHLDLAAACKK
jgi:ABC-type transport system substrate-binding protein